MQVRGGRVQGRDAHLARLRQASLEFYGSAPDADALREKIRDALDAGGMADGDCTLRVRIQASSATAAPDIGIDIELPRHPSPRALRVCTHPGPRACPGIKHLALGHQLRARESARRGGFDDALLVTDDGCVVEGSFWNIAFWDGVSVVWPEGPSLRGVTQMLLARALADAGIAQRHAPVAADGLGTMRAAFTVNSTGIQDIAAIDGHAFRGDARVGVGLRERLAAVPRERF